MCQILKTAYNNGTLMIEISSSRDLLGCTFCLYLYDFQKGAYNEAKPYYNYKITTMHVSYDNSGYIFKCAIPANSKIKCVIADSDNILLSKERYIGDKHNIHIRATQYNLSYIFKIVSDVSVSRNLVYYKSPVSSVKFNLPGDLVAGTELVFAVKGLDFFPKFKLDERVKDCFNIEG